MGVIYREYSMDEVKKKADEALTRLETYNRVSDVSYCSINIAGSVNAIRLLTEASRCYNVVGSEDSDDEEETMRQYEDEDGSIDLEKLNRHYNMARLISTHHKKLQLCATELRDCVQEVKSINDDVLERVVEKARDTIEDFLEVLLHPAEAIKAMNAEKRRKRIEARKLAGEYIPQRRTPQTTEVVEEEETDTEEEEQQTPPQPKRSVVKPKEQEPKALVEEAPSTRTRRSRTATPEEPPVEQPPTRTRNRTATPEEPPVEQPPTRTRSRTATPEEAPIEQPPIRTRSRTATPEEAPATEEKKEEPATPTRTRRSRTATPEEAPATEEKKEEPATPTRARRSRTATPEETPATEEKKEEPATPTRARRSRTATPEETPAEKPADQPKEEGKPAEEEKPTEGGRARRTRAPRS